ncbi:MAG: hypothetical protein GY947_17365 [Rhodobacteraceae bacterium]|nr:hypothetical protein [Paracoccaceae bacterium]
MIKKILVLLQGLAVCLLFAVSAQAAGERWRYLPPEESGSESGWHGALIEAGDRFIAMVFSLEVDKWFVSFGLPLERIPESITSRIVKSDGKAMALTLESGKFNAKYIESTGLTLLTFEISQGDIELIQSSKNWILVIDDIQYRFTLDGSRDALDLAVAYLAQDQQSTAAETAMQAMNECDSLAGHPWDVYGESSGKA